jgi:hypothetical protein
VLSPILASAAMAFSSATVLGNSLPVRLSAVHEALRAVSRDLLRNHVEHCASAAIAAGGAEADAMDDELVDLTPKHTR